MKEVRVEKKDGGYVRVLEDSASREKHFLESMMTQLSTMEGQVCISLGAEVYAILFFSFVGVSPAGTTYNHVAWDSAYIVTPLANGKIAIPYAMSIPNGDMVLQNKILEEADKLWRRNRVEILRALE